MLQKSKGETMFNFKSVWVQVKKALPILLPIGLGIFYVTQWNALNNVLALSIPVPSWLPSVPNNILALTMDTVGVISAWVLLRKKDLANLTFNKLVTLVVAFIMLPFSLALNVLLVLHLIPR